jgi:hypothetical protein
LNRARAAAARIREIQKRSQPDPEGWTVKDYINQLGGLFELLAALALERKALRGELRLH